MQKWGYVGRDGAWQVEPAWDLTSGFSDGRAWVYRGELVGFIDRDGRVVVEPAHGFATSFSDGLAKVGENEHSTHVIDLGGRPVYRARKPGHGGLVPVAGERGWGIVDRDGRVIVELAYQDSDANDDAIWIRRRDQEWVVLSRTGEQLYEHRETAPMRWLRNARRLAEGWVVHIGSDTGGTQLIFDAQFQPIATLEGDWIDHRDGIYRVHHHNNARIPEAQILPGAPFDRFYDAAFQLVDIATLPAAPQLHVRTAGRAKEVWFGDRPLDGGPFTEAYVGGTTVMVATGTGKQKRWGLLAETGWIVPAEHAVLTRFGDHWVAGELGKVGVVDRAGRWLFERAHIAVKPLAEDRFAIYEGGKALKSGKLAGGAWRLVDNAGAAIGDLRFADVGDAYLEDVLAVAVATTATKRIRAPRG